MKCPYMTNETSQLVQRYAYDSDGVMIKLGEISKTIVEPTDCLREDCAAWNDGKCNYKG